MGHTRESTIQSWQPLHPAIDDDLASHKSWNTTVEDLGTTECKRHFFCIENALQKMRTAVPALIQELQEACRLSLYNGNSLGLEVFKKPRDGSNPSTTKRRRQDVTSTKPRDWETVRSVLDVPM